MTQDALFGAPPHPPASPPKPRGPVRGPPP